MINRNWDHERAARAYNCVNSIKGKGSTGENYHSAVRSAGILIQNSGLLQTLSFYLSKQKKNEQYKFLAAHILGWIFFTEEIDFTEEINLDMYTLLLDYPDELILFKTQETKSFLIWLKRFADAMLN